MCPNGHTSSQDMPSRAHYERHFLLPPSYSLPATGYRLPATGYWLPATDYCFLLPAYLALPSRASTASACANSLNAFSWRLKSGVCDARRPFVYATPIDR